MGKEESKRTVRGHTQSMWKHRNDALFQNTVFESSRKRRQKVIYEVGIQLDIRNDEKRVARDDLYGPVYPDIRHMVHT